MGKIRDNTKWIMLMLALAFAAWLVLDWVQSRQTTAATGPNPVVGVVNGREIRYAEWSRYLDVQLQQARQRVAGSLTDEQRRQVTQDSWEDLINAILIEQELDRLGIGVSDEEVRQAFRISPPPDLMLHPAFQTDGVFDYDKYQEFFSNPGVDETLLLQIEAYYRDALPRQKLSSQLSDGVFVSDAELWHYYRERNETATVSFVSIDPDAEVADDSVPVTATEVERYYRSHSGDFARPATAVVHIVSLSAAPTPADTAAARARADSLRQVIQTGQQSFDEVAAAASDDSASATDGGQLGRFGRGQLVPSLDEAAFSLRPGTVSEPVLSPSGFHLLRVDARSGDTVTARHILVAIRLSPEGEDELFDQLDRLEGVALREGLEAAADSVNVPLRRGVTLTRGFDFVPGAGSLGVGVDWAFQPGTLVGDVSDFFENQSGYHILELLDRAEEGAFELEEVRPQIERILRAERKKERAREMADRLVDLVSKGASLEEASDQLGWTTRTAGPFTRTEFVDGLGRDTPAVGAAFGLPVGATSGPLDAGDRIVVLRVDARQEASREEFQTTKEPLRAQLIFQRRQEKVTRWLQALRETAEVVDLRDRLTVNAAT
ncbi:MAG: SurA N-terminal domain-containing protein [Gemmatimonadota bacterium]